MIKLDWSKIIFVLIKKKRNKIIKLKFYSKQIIIVF